MTKFLALNISVSKDGYMCGPRQSKLEPFGENAEQLLHWAWKTKAVREWSGLSDGTTGIDNDSWARIFNVGANIMGRNMFGHIRGPWHDETWRGWWATRGSQTACRSPASPPPGTNAGPIASGWPNRPTWTRWSRSKTWRSVSANSQSKP